MAKANKKTETMPNFGSESFEQLLNETLGAQGSFVGQVVEGRIVAIDKESVVIDVGLKSEGRVSLREFSSPNDTAKLQIGDKVEVYVERLEDRNGEAVLSREKARREEAWEELEKLHLAGERVNGTIFNKVKGGFTVDLKGAVAFLPGSQVDIRPVRDISPLMGAEQPFIILKMDRVRGNIVVSRRAILEESRAEARTEILSDIQEGQIVKGIVKNITDYGAFIDLGGVDGLLHVTDISWSRINHPSEVLEVGQSIDVQIIKFNQENQRISLGMKQLSDDPWKAVEQKYKQGTKLKGKVTNITDYGAFVELETGIEGLIHVSEMSWTKKNIHPGKILSTSEEVQVVVLEVDNAKRRISLGIKQLQENPWAGFAATHKQGQIIDGKVTNVTEFGLFVDLGGDIEGMVHVSDISWEQDGEIKLKAFKAGDAVQVKVLEISPEKERVALGIKQLSEDTSGRSSASSSNSTSSNDAEGPQKNAVVTCTITSIDDKNGVEVSVADGYTGYIKKVDLSREKSEQRTDRFAVGEKVDAKVLTVTKKTRSLTLSIKARELDEDKKALAQYGSSDSGASLGDILGAAIQAKESDKTEKKAEKKPAAKSKKAE